MNNTYMVVDELVGSITSLVDETLLDLGNIVHNLTMHLTFLPYSPAHYAPWSARTAEILDRHFVHLQHTIEGRLLLTSKCLASADNLRSSYSTLNSSRHATIKRLGMEPVPPQRNPLQSQQPEGVAVLVNSLEKTELAADFHDDIGLAISRVWGGLRRVESRLEKSRLVFAETPLNISLVVETAREHLEVMKDIPEIAKRLVQNARAEGESQRYYSRVSRRIEHFIRRVQLDVQALEEELGRQAA
ncbi:hypothetical protein ABEF95_003604 [Exophiala dermatitidis]